MTTPDPNTPIIPGQPPAYIPPTTAPTVVRRVHPLSIAFFVVGIVSCILGVIFAASGLNSSPTPAAAQTTQQQATTNPAAPTGPATTTTQPAAPAPAGIHGDGVFLVPAEVKPGTYRATVPADSTGCYWERLKGTSGSFDDIIANANGNPGERMTVTIKPTDKAFHTQDCGDWQKIG